MRLAYADPPYPGKAHLYPENMEVDHAELIGRLREYDGWALSTDEPALQRVLALCPDDVRVGAWCRPNAPPFGGHPYQAWEPLVLSPARTAEVPSVRSYLLAGAPIGQAQHDGITGQKTTAFAVWMFQCLGAEQGDTLDDLYPGTGVVGRAFDGFSQQLTMAPFPDSHRSYRSRMNQLRRIADPLPGLDPVSYVSERL